MKELFYFFFGWLIGSGSGEEVVEVATSVPGAAIEVTAEATQMVSSTPWLFIPVLIAIISMGIRVFSRFIADDKDNGRG